MSKAPPELRELGPHISTRLNLLPRAWTRFRVLEQKLTTTATAIATPNHMFNAGKEGYGLQMPMEHVYDFIAAADSALFETHACCELIRGFMQRALLHRGRARVGSLKEEFKAAVAAGGCSTTWCDELEAVRDYFIHGGTVYVAIDTSGPPDVLMMKRNIKQFDDPSSYVRSSTLSPIYGQFLASLPGLQEYLLSVYR